MLILSRFWWWWWSIVVDTDWYVGYGDNVQWPTDQIHSNGTLTLVILGSSSISTAKLYMQSFGSILSQHWQFVFQKQFVFLIVLLCKIFFGNSEVLMMTPSQSFIAINKTVEQKKVTIIRIVSKWWLTKILECCWSVWTSGVVLILIVLLDNFVWWHHTVGE